MTEPKADADEVELFRAYAATGDRALRNRLVEQYMGLAAHIAKRFKRAGGDDDIRQAAMVGLVKAVERFDPDYGVAFATFAGSTIEGELKRHLRDHTWVVRVPRSGKDLHLLVRRAADELAQTRGRSPSVDELSTHLQISRDDVLRGLAASAAYDVASLDSPSDTGAVTADRSAALASEDVGYGHTVNARVVEQLLFLLPDREREIVRLRFFEDRSQAEIADAIGISQMHVSRLLRRALETMRSHLADETD
jgi:RNA polymerase sigma-B factor